MGGRRGPRAGWPTVNIRYLRTYPQHPLTIARLRLERPDLSPLLLNGFQAASFPIPASDFRAVLDMLGEELNVLLPEITPPPPADAAVLAQLEDRYLHAVPEVRERISRSIERGPVGAKVKKANGYRCQVCSELGLDPLGFRKPDGEPNVEAHHVMPVSKGQMGSLAAANVITLCANHHRQIHYGGVVVVTEADAFKITIGKRAVTIPRWKVPAL